MRAPHLIRPACAALALCAAGALAGPAQAQYARDVYVDDTYVDEIVVPGRYGPDGPTTLSRAVSHRDLDLRTYEGQRVLRMRIRDTARDLCRLLGEGPGNGGPLLLGRSCEDDAVRGARRQMRVAVNRAHARAYASLDY